MFYAGFFPIGIGLVFWTPVICAWEWFPERKGLISGLIISGFGFGAFIYSFITTSICNPHDLKPQFHKTQDSVDKVFPIEVAVKVPEMIRTCLLSWTIMVLLGILLISRHPDYTKKVKEVDIKDIHSHDLEQG